MTSEKLEFMAIKDDVRVLKEKGDKVHLKNTFKTPLGIIASKYEKKKKKERNTKWRSGKTSRWSNCPEDWWHVTDAVNAAWDAVDKDTAWRWPWATLMLTVMPGVHWDSWISGFSIFIKFGKYVFKYLSCAPSPWRTPVAYIQGHLELSHSSGMLCSLV